MAVEVLAARAVWVVGVVAVVVGALSGLLGPAPARADSPLGELTAIAQQYEDLPEVKAAMEGGVVTPALAAFLLSAAPLDHKLAVVAAFGIRPEPSTGSVALARALSAAHKRAPSALAAADLTPAEAFVLGLTVALEQHRGDAPLNVGGPALRKQTAQSLLDDAAARLPDSFTAHYVQALSATQGLEDFCAVYKRAAAVNARFAPEARDLRAAAFTQIDAYIQTYADACPDTPEGRAVALSTLNEVYRVLRVGPYVLTATQGGAVLWDPGQVAAPRAIAPASICTHAVTRHSQAWIGCQDKLLHFDGAAFHTLASTRADDADGYRPILAPDGEVIVLRAGSAWAIRANALTPLVPPPADAAAYDTLLRANGERWSIEFLDGVRTPNGFWPKSSPEYPGTDPRRLYEAPDGSLWVQDFERGAFRLSDDGARFQHQPGLDAQCTGVALDTARARLWLLHYREGLRLIANDAIAARVDLSHLGYMRDLSLDDDGSLWVAGWGSLAHVSPLPDGSWTHRPFTVRSLPDP